MGGIRLGMGVDPQRRQYEIEDRIQKYNAPRPITGVMCVMGAEDLRVTHTCDT